jgi:hypothetical protein
MISMRCSKRSTGCRRPERRYRLGETVDVWSDIRPMGFGAHRPVFVPGHDSPGFQGEASRYMLRFTDERTPAGQPVADASEFTFYSALPAQM